MPYMQVMKFDLSDEQAAALTKELSDIIENDRWPFSPRDDPGGASCSQRALAPSMRTS
jgi:hypothetical protein